MTPSAGLRRAASRADGRRHGRRAHLRIRLRAACVTSVDGMTADFYHYDMEFLGRAATRIINEVRGINRVVYDVTPSRRHDRSGSEENGGDRRVQRRIS